MNNGVGRFSVQRWKAPSRRSQRCVNRKYQAYQALTLSLGCHTSTVCQLCSNVARCQFDQDIPVDQAPVYISRRSRALQSQNLLETIVFLTNSFVPGACTSLAYSGRSCMHQPARLGFRLSHVPCGTGVSFGHPWFRDLQRTTL